MSTLLVVVATLVAKPGHEATLKAAPERLVPPSRAEAGCSRYELHADNAQPGSFVMLEEWRDLDAVQEHEATPHFKALLQAIDGKADLHIVQLTKIA